MPDGGGRVDRVGSSGWNDVTHVKRLRERAQRIRSWPVEESYLYFNNDWEGFAPRNAVRLRELLGEPEPD